jgi:hypothetical protein
LKCLIDASRRMLRTACAGFLQREGAPARAEESSSSSLHRLRYRPRRRRLGGHELRLGERGERRADSVPGYEASTFFGIGAPSSMPTEIMEKLNRQVNVSLAEPDIKARLTEMGGMVLAGSPADLGRLTTEETEKWAKVVKFAGIKPE